MWYDGFNMATVLFTGTKDIWLIIAAILPLISAAVIVIRMVIKRRIRSESLLEASGFVYDEKQGIFYSTMDAWQRKFGYCQLYDEAAPPLGIIFDCLPVRFDYEGKHWLIELWKGQYGMALGCEVGVYTTAGKELWVNGFDGTLYDHTDDENHLWIRFGFLKDGRLLFSRHGRHWWLTGFILGDFAQPEQVSVQVEIVMKDEEMARAFIRGIYEAGYGPDSCCVEGRSVYIYFDKPGYYRPMARTKFMDWFQQSRNKYFCDLYQKLTKDIDDSHDKLNYLQKNAPFLYRRLFNLTRGQKRYRGYHKIDFFHKSKEVQ